MLKKIISLLKKPGSPSEITLLIIGPPSSGKTALIYFLYRFATDHLTGSFKKSNNTPNTVTPSQTQITDTIREVELSSFVNDMIRGINTSKDFIGTEAGTIDYINYDTGLLSLKIFNISGEIFSDTITHSSILTKLAIHLDSSKIDDVYCLLVDEVKIGNSPNYNVSMFAVKAFFATQGLSKASKIFDNVNKGKNTLRVVTKFDKQYVPEKPNDNLDSKTKEFSIYQKALSELKSTTATGNHLEQHKISYNTPAPVFFEGSQNTKYCKSFVCTGLYDKSTFSSELYENDNVENKPVLKPKYRGNGLNILEMYGVTEIFACILSRYKVRKKIKIIQPLNSSRNNSDSITISDYKKILNIK